MTKIINARVLTENGFENKDIYIENGKFTSNASACDNIIDAKGKMLIPGFMDIHIHGVCGYDFNDGNLQGLDVIANFLASHGTTSVLATTSTTDKDVIANAVKALAEKMKTGTTGAEIIGLHMEGPIFSDKAIGAQNPAYIQQATIENVDAMLGENKDILKMLALSPELEGSFELIDQLTARGVVCAIGHTGADYECAVKAIEHGCTMMTHFYNAMTPLKHREPGVVGAVLEGRGADVQLICDFVHVHPGALNVAIKCAEKEHVIMISDAISGTGLGDGVYDLGGLEVFVNAGVARIAGGALAGSTLTLDTAMKNMVGIGYSIEDVSKFLSYNPARALGMADRKGLIKDGWDADAIIIDDDFNVMTTIVGGKCVYTAE